MLEFLNTHNLSFDQWATNLDKISNAKTKKKVSDMISIFQAKISIDAKCTSKYHNLFFAQLFLSYAKSKKGDVALSILTSEKIVNQISVITYIKEGLEWLSK